MDHDFSASTTLMQPFALRRALRCTMAWPGGRVQLQGVKLPLALLVAGTAAVALRLRPLHWRRRTE
jgi:hypothetical protein